MASNQSLFDPSRKNVGAIYRDVAIKNTETSVVNGDLTHELMKSLVDDLNGTIASNPYDGQPFYITVYEKKDLMMPRAILRRLYTTRYRPYPEADTVVFKVEPRSNTVEFCWCLPHKNEMSNMLENPTLYNKQMLSDIRAWIAEDLPHFGFKKAEGKIVADANPVDRSLENRFAQVGWN